MAFTSLSNVRTFCAHFILSDECFKHNKVMVSWDLFVVFLTAAELYSPFTWTHTPAGNSQEKVEGPLEMRQSNMHFLKERSGDLPPCFSSLPDWLIVALCKSIICPFFSQRCLFIYFNRAKFLPERNVRKLYVRNSSDTSSYLIPFYQKWSLNAVWQ